MKGLFYFLTTPISFCLYLPRVGTDVIFHLLTEASIFIALPNNCYCQLVGEPILSLTTPTILRQALPACSAPHEDYGHLKRPRAACDVGDRPAKRLKISNGVSSGKISGLYRKDSPPVVYVRSVVTLL